MFIDCLCPAPTALTQPAAITCGENLGQIVKLAIQRKQATAAFPTKVGSGVGDAGVLASWTARKAANDNTKIISTPFIEGFTVPPISAIKEGGDDNSTLDGIAVVVGTNTSVCAGFIRSLPASILLDLKKLNCEPNLEAYFINEFGYIIGMSANGTTFNGITISNFFMGDGGNEGKNSHDKTPFELSLRYGWRDKLAIVKPADFNGRDL